MKSIFLSRSRLKSQKDFQDDPKLKNATFIGNPSDKKKGPHKKDKRDTYEERRPPFNGRDEGSCEGMHRAWTAPPSMRIVSPHKATVNERSSSEYSLQLSGLQKQSYGHRSGPDYTIESPSGGGHIDQQFETGAHHQNRDKRPCRGASFSSWFGPTLKYVFDSEKEDRNEIRVLALGIQQFIDEIFDALDDNKRGYIHHQDFMTLCGLLGKNLPSRDISVKCTSEICVNETCAIHVHYYGFKETIQSLFESKERLQNVSDYRNNEKLIETVAKVSRRTESLKYIAKLLDEVEDKAKASYTTGPSPHKGHSLIRLDKSRNQRESKLFFKNLDLHRQVLLQLQELQCLREIVEDFRVALQTSDAENLALRVAAKREHEPCIKCASERSNLEQLSFPNEDDSIDRLIINFPSSEALRASVPNFPSFHPAEGTAATSSNQSLMESQFRNLLDKSYEDLDIQYELEEVYRELFEAKEKIVDLKLNLERNKTRELNEAAFQLNRMTEEVAKATEAQNELKGENQRCRTQLEKIYSANEAMLEEMKELKEKCESTTNELEEMKKNLKRTKKFRRQEIKQFADLRNLLKDALAATNDSQTNQYHDPTQSHLWTGCKVRFDEGVSRESHLSNGCPTISRVMTSESPGKRKLDHDFQGQKCLETYDNVDCNEHYRMKLRREALQVETEDEENQFCGIFPVSSIEIERDKNNGQRKKVRKEVTQNIGLRSNLTRILPSVDIKPVLEVKPNIIKPWISFDQPLKDTTAEVDFEIEKDSFGLASPTRDSLEFAKVSSELCKEITETFSILNESMDSYGSSESYGSLKSPVSVANIGFMEGYDSSNSIHSESGSYIARNEHGEEKTLSPFYTENSCEVYENSENFGMLEYFIPRFEEISIPYKSSPRSSTQILESLEFEVDLLRKSLEEENLWR